MALTPEGTPYVESSDLVANYPAASLSLANRVDLVGVLPFADSAARATAIPSPTDGQFTYLQDTNTAEFYNGSAYQAIGGGKLLQVVRATDSTSRSTASTSFVDVTGMSITITPASVTNIVLILASVRATAAGNPRSNVTGRIQITDSSNNALSGADDVKLEIATATADLSLTNQLTFIGYVIPGTTLAVTYKCRFATAAGTQTITLNNNLSTGQIYAIEVSA